MNVDATCFGLSEGWLGNTMAHNEVRDAFGEIMVTKKHYVLISAGI